MLAPAAPPPAVGVDDDAAAADDEELARRLHAEINGLPRESRKRQASQSRLQAASEARAPVHVCALSPARRRARAARGSAQDAVHGHDPGLLPSC